MHKVPETTVDRSRLTLLLGLTSTAAAVGCGTVDGHTPSGGGFDAEQAKKDNDSLLNEPMGGEGEGGGGSH